MLHVDIPTLPEIQRLIAKRNALCVSIYLETTPQTQEIGKAEIVFSNLIKEADAQLEKAGVDKRERWAIVEQLEEVATDEAFWRFQANSLAIFATPDAHFSYRLPNKLKNQVEVSDRFYIKPLIRAISVEQHAFVLALAENEVRLIEVFSDMPAAEVLVSNLPTDAASAIGVSSVNSRSPASGRQHGSEGQKVYLRKFCRIVDAALRPVLAGRHEPLILAAAEPLLSIYRSINSYPEFVDAAILTSPARISTHELADAARPILDQRQVDAMHDFAALYSERESDGRATCDIAQAARAATFGAIQTLVVDIEGIVPGRIDEATGEVSFADHADANTYGIVDEIAGRTLAHGGKVIGERKSAIPGGGSLAAVLRYPV